MTILHPIDHLVLPVEQLADARARYEQLGFQVQPDRQHPFGTENCCVMFANGTYLEPLAVGEREDLEKAIVERNLFVRRQDAYRFRHDEGIVMLALKTADAHADHQVFCDLGYAAGEPFAFERAATAADGSETRIGVRIAFAEDHRSPDCLFFTCEHLSADTLWTPDNIVHANGVIGITAVYMSEPNPADFQYYLETLTGQRDIRASSAGIEADTGHGLVAILTPYALNALFDVPSAHHGRGLQLRGFSLAVPDIEGLADYFDGQEVDYRRHGPRIIVDPAAGLGAFICFEEAAS
jgi:hypothetical protein